MKDVTRAEQLLQEVVGMRKELAPLSRWLPSLGASRFTADAWEARGLNLPDRKKAKYILGLKSYILKEHHRLDKLDNKLHHILVELEDAQPGIFEELANFSESALAWKSKNFSDEEIPF